ncbi:MAG: hypothetical protein ACLVEW_02500 [Peptoniphilus sp.]|uniref:hypothetical protein n=1 Tax=Peptoniphilus sp. TaxID=1971214 RepID=UPI00399B49C1
MKKRKFNVSSLCAKVMIYLPIILLNVFYFMPDLIGKYIIEEEFVESLGVILPALIGVGEFIPLYQIIEGRSFLKKLGKSFWVLL